MEHTILATNNNVDCEIILISRDEARELTEAIKSTSVALFTLLKKAHDSRAWEVLGFNSWSEYIKNEFDFSRQYSYRLVNQANVIEQINEAGEIDYYISEKEANIIKKKLPEITERIKNETENIESEEEKKEVVNTIIKEEVGYGYGGDEPEEDEDDFEGYDEYDLEKAKREGFKEGLNQVSDDIYDQKDKVASGLDFYLQSLMRTLDIFNALPETKEMIKIVKNSNDTQDKLVENAECALEWLKNFIEGCKGD